MKTIDQTKNRVVWIDLARAIAIVMVIIGHSQGAYYGDYWTRLLFSVHLPIFFVLSGYLYHDKTLKQTLRSDWWTLIVPYLTTVGLGAIIIAIKEFHSNFLTAPSRNTTLKQLLASAIYGIGPDQQLPIVNYHLAGIGALWFLMAFLVGRLVFAGIMKLVKSDLVRVGTAIMLTISGYLLSKLLLLPWSINSALYVQIFFLAGYYVRKYQVMEKISHGGMLGLTVIFILSGLLGQLRIDNVTDPTIVLGTLAGISNSIWLMKGTQYLAKWLKVWPRLLAAVAFIGQQSLVILCLHLLDLEFIGVWIHVLYATASLGYLPSIWMGIAYRVAVVILGAWLIQFIPGLRSLYMYRSFPFRRK